MRHIAVFILAITLAATMTAGHSARAQNGMPNSNNGTGHVFGSADCRKKVACPDSSVPDSPADLIANASACITQNFGYLNNGDGFFEDSGTDSNNCLTAKANALPKGVGAQLTPQCCIIQNNDGSCNFHCDLSTVQSH